MWTSRTAVAQAELEDRERPGAYHRVRFGVADGDGVEIETTRPELIPACVALVANPEDSRFQKLVGRQAISPVFGVRVPIVAHQLADPEKGTGIAMICTFGDLTDVTWWRELGLPVRTIIQPDGKLRPIRWGDPGWESADPASAQHAYDMLTGLTVEKARSRMVEVLTDTGTLVGEPRPVTHNVKFFEKGDRPLEIVTSRQWFIKTVEFREELLTRGRELEWYPVYMQARYENWANGLNGDWCVSRQRFFGVPFPVWYRVTPAGSIDYSALILPPESRLPIDPSSDVPDGFSSTDRGRPGGFSGDTDVMDTWATSSLTPQIAGGWEEDEDLFRRVFPMDLRPQGHDIIRDVVVRYGAARAFRARGCCRGRTRQSRGSSRTPIEKRCPSRRECGDAPRATPGTWVGRRSLLGRERTTGKRYGVRCGTDARRPAPRDQDT